MNVAIQGVRAIATAAVRTAGAVVRLVRRFSRYVRATASRVVVRRRRLRRSARAPGRPSPEPVAA